MRIEEPRASALISGLMKPIEELYSSFKWFVAIVFIEVILSGLTKITLINLNSLSSLVALIAVIFTLIDIWRNITVGIKAGYTEPKLAHWYLYGMCCGLLFAWAGIFTEIGWDSLIIIGVSAGSVIFGVLRKRHYDEDKRKHYANK